MRDRGAASSRTASAPQHVLCTRACYDCPQPVVSCWYISGAAESCIAKQHAIKNVDRNAELAAPFHNRPDCCCSQTCIPGCLDKTATGAALLRLLLLLKQA